MLNISEKKIELNIIMCFFFIFVFKKNINITDLVRLIHIYIFFVCFKTKILIKRIKLY